MSFIKFTDLIRRYCQVQICSSELFQIEDASKRSDAHLRTESRAPERDFGFDLHHQDAHSMQFANPNSGRTAS